MRGALLLLLLLASSAEAETSGWLPSPATDPLEFGSIRTESAFAPVLGSGRWNASLTVTQFNLWDHTWHTAATHRDRFSTRQPMTDEELRYLESAFPQDAIHHVDVEGWRTDLYLSRGFGRATISAHLPWIEIGRPHWDGIAEEFHEVLGVDRLERDLFVRGDTIVYIKDRNNDHILQAGSGLERSGLGDTTLAVTVPLMRMLEADMSIAVSLQAPTGREATLQGSGGWDANVSAFAAWNFDKVRYRAAAGVSYLDTHGSVLGFERSQLAHFMVEADRKIWTHYRLTATTRVDASPLYNVSDDYIGFPSTYYRFGVTRELPAGGWISANFGNAFWPQTGIDADWMFQVMSGFSTVRW